jgi:hypothetical protein
VAKKKAKAEPRSRHYREDGAYQRRMQKRADRDAALPADDDGPTLSSAWWSLTGEPCTSAVFGWIDRLRSRHRRQAMMDALWEAVYKDTPLGSTLDANVSVAAMRTQQSRQNIIMSMVDTLGARIAKRRPFPVISADDAGPSEKLFAKRASRALRRKMGKPDVERRSPLCARDGLIRGSGVMKAYRDGGDVFVERVPRRELFVDPAEAQYGTPRVMAQLKRVDRSVVMAMFPTRAAELKLVSRAPRDEWSVTDETSDADLIEIGEAWHLPSKLGGDDGCHVILVRGLTPLRCEQWTRSAFPFAFFQFNEALDGFWGTGLVAHAAPIQQEINSMLRDMGEGISLGMQLKVFLPRGSNVNKNHMRARNPAIIEYDGAKPEYEAPLPFNPGVLSYLQWRIQQAYEMAGISQAAATSKSSLGNGASGKALDTQYDIESDRFSHVELQYAMFRVDVGRCLLDEARALYAEANATGADRVADAIDKNELAPWIKELDWSRVDLDSGDYHLNLEPINFLPDARSGKLAQVKEMSEAGLLQNPMQTAALFDEPDIARANRYMLGPYRMLERWCEALADLDIDLESLQPQPVHLAQRDLAKQMVIGELSNQMADAHSPPTDEEDEIQSRYRWALDMLKASATGIGPSASPAMGAPAPMPPDPTMGGMPAPMMPPGPGPDPMGGMTSQLAAGMPAPAGMTLQ